MHRYLPKQADIDRIMEEINRKYLTKLQLPVALEVSKLHTLAVLTSEIFIYLLELTKCPAKLEQQVSLNPIL